MVQTHSNNQRTELFKSLKKMKLINGLSTRKNPINFPIFLRPFVVARPRNTVRLAEGSNGVGENTWGWFQIVDLSGNHR